MKLSCLIIDDEEIAARGVEGYARQVPYFENVHLCASALKAMDLLANIPIDIIFLDIEMPKLTGLQFLKSLTSPPLIVIISAYSDYALEGSAHRICGAESTSVRNFLKAHRRTINHLLSPFDP